MWTRAIILGIWLASPLGAAEEPLSAIDWLSRSVEVGHESALPGSVTVTPLAAPPRAIGAIRPESVGLSPTIWTGSRSEDLVRLVAAMPADMPLPLRDVLATLLSLDAPVDDPEQAFLVARIDALLTLGRIESAQRLIDDAGSDMPPALFRRAFDISLLMGSEDDGCRRLQSRPDMSPTYPARIFCLARRGDWQAAALTLETAQALDMMTSDEFALLGRFLHDGEEDLLPPPARPDTITPLTFRLYEAIGEPLSTRALPLAFARADLRPQNGWKTRLEAGERLYRAGAIPAETLVDLYTERAPAASGGVWDRVAAVQAWQDAAPTDEPEAAATAAEVLAAAGLARLLGREVPPDRVAPIDRDAEPDPDLARLVADGRQGEAALMAISRAAAAWDGDPDDLSGALATLQAIGLDPVQENDAPQWAANR